MSEKSLVNDIIVLKLTIASLKNEVTELNNILAEVCQECVPSKAEELTVLQQQNKRYREALERIVVDIKTIQGAYIIVSAALIKEDV